MLIAVPVLIELAFCFTATASTVACIATTRPTKRSIAKYGRLNKQVLDLMDEKNKLLALKVNAMGGTKQNSVRGRLGPGRRSPAHGGQRGGRRYGRRCACGRGRHGRRGVGATRRSRSMAMASRMPRPPSPVTVKAKTLAEEKRSPRPTASPSCPLWTLSTATGSPRSTTMPSRWRTLSTASARSSAAR